ncbi:MAG: acetylornithine transaminase [Bifidobacteriaceae bacterium]|jgi:acetylornithine aminotransferase|nr:acetylornithine transaminase [Bifidobacteriaceae bacterium]
MPSTESQPSVSSWSAVRADATAGLPPTGGTQPGEAAPLASSWLARYRDSALGVFSPGLVLARGQGAVVWDVDGREYLDLLAGIAVNALGHAHPAWVEAIHGQAARLGHISNFYASEPQIELAEKLLQLTGAAPGGRVFFANSGAEANEAALKAVLRSAGAGTRLVALEGSFHGRTLGALSLTAKAAYRQPFADFTGPVEFLPVGDVVALEAALKGGGVAALVLEVIQGEAGVRPPPTPYLAAARRLTSQYGALLWIDEIQTGTGRTGTWMAYQNPALGGPLADDAAPDLVTAAKGLGGGFPIGAMVAMNAATAGLLQPGDHGTTFGGGPLAAAVALATIKAIADQGLMAQAATLGQQWRAELATVPGVKATRGAGLLIGIVLEKPNAPEVVKAAQVAGFLINSTGPETLRLAPPLILTAAQAQQFTDALPALLKESN